MIESLKVFPDPFTQVAVNHIHIRVNVRLVGQCQSSTSSYYIQGAISVTARWMCPESLDLSSLGRASRHRGKRGKGERPYRFWVRSPSEAPLPLHDDAWSTGASGHYLGQCYQRQGYLMLYTPTQRERNLTQRLLFNTPWISERRKEKREKQNYREILLHRMFRRTISPPPESSARYIRGAMQSLYLYK